MKVMKVFGVLWGKPSTPAGGLRDPEISKNDPAVLVEHRNVTSLSALEEQADKLVAGHRPGIEIGGRDHVVRIW